jgi:hypothetical protein
LELVKDDPDHMCTHWVARADVKDSLVTPEDVSTPARPFSLPVFSLDIGLAYGLHRDCIIASTKKLILKRFLLYEQAARQHAFPLGSTLYGTRVERSVYLWIARPRKIRSWYKDLGIAGFIKPDSLPPYFRDRVVIYVAWNEPAPIVPWESNEEALLRLSKEDVFEQSDIASQVTAHAGHKCAPPMEEVITVASSAAGATSDSRNLWDLLDSRDTKCTRFWDPASLFPPAAPTDSVLSR